MIRSQGGSSCRASAYLHLKGCSAVPQSNKHLQPRTLESMHGWQAQAERSKWQHRHTQLGRLAAWPRPLAWSWAAALRLGYAAVDHTRNALILSVFGFKVSAQPCKLGRGRPRADASNACTCRCFSVHPAKACRACLHVTAPDACSHEEQAGQRTSCFMLSHGLLQQSSSLGAAAGLPT